LPKFLVTCVFIVICELWLTYNNYKKRKEKKKQKKRKRERERLSERNKNTKKKHTKMIKKTKQNKKSVLCLLVFLVAFNFFLKSEPAFPVRGTWLGVSSEGWYLLGSLGWFSRTRR
jgi:uncharacterized ion transporter superfamily protein YfcC